MEDVYIKFTNFSAQQSASEQNYDFIEYEKWDVVEFDELLWHTFRKRRPHARRRQCPDKPDLMCLERCIM